jgi:hypothetical protein
MGIFMKLNLRQILINYISDINDWVNIRKDYIILCSYDNQSRRMFVYDLTQNSHDIRRMEKLMKQRLI